MCGRLACGLEPQDVCNSCCYKLKGEDRFLRPQWRNVSNSGLNYRPSYNICPTEVAPVLLSGSHFKSNNRIVAPMIFGVIPQWSEVNENKKYSTINCRIETMKSSKLYSGLLVKGQRCIVVCSGFFEWKKQNKTKKPYFIHVKQPENVQMGEPETWNLQFTEEEGFKGIRMLKLAGLFEISHSKTMEEATLSFTIITKNASSDMMWLHNRMPVTVETEEQIDAWLSCNTDADQALACLSMKDNFLYYPVAKNVSYLGNKDMSCIRQELELEQKKSCKSANLMLNWLKRKQSTNEDIAKKMKKGGD